MSGDRANDAGTTEGHTGNGAAAWRDAVRSLAAREAGLPGVTKGVLSRISARHGDAAGDAATRLLCVLVPGRSDVWVAVVDIETARENWRAAVAAGTRALSSGVADHGLAHRIAAIAFRAGQDETVVRLCHATRREAGTGLDRGLAGVMFLLGRALLRLGRIEEGRATLARAVALDGSFEFAAEVLGYAMTDADFDEARAAVAGPSAGGGDLDG